MCTRLTRQALILLALSTLSLPRLLHAQASAGGNTFLAVPESFPDIDARAMLVREPGVDLVLLPEDNVNVHALFMALAVLDQVRTRHPAPEHGQIVPITGYVVTSPPTGERLRSLQRALDRLEHAESTELGSLGRGRGVPLPGR